MILKINGFSSIYCWNYSISRSYSKSIYMCPPWIEQPACWSRLKPFSRDWSLRKCRSEWRDGPLLAFIFTFCSKNWSTNR